MRGTCLALSGRAGLFIAIAAIGGCGDSTPETDSGSPAPAAAPATSGLASAMAVSPVIGAFTAVSPGTPSKNARAEDACNVDSIDGRPAANADLQRTSSPVFAGWISDSASGTVPPRVTIILKGQGDFAVTASTGAVRADVAKARNRPSLLHSGYMVKADLARVPAGEYSLVLLGSASGHDVICDTRKQVSVHEK